MAARLDSLRVRMADHSALLRQLDRADPAPPAPVYVGGKRMLLQTRNGIRLLCDSRDLQITPDLIFDRVWEPALTEFYEHAIQPGAQVLEIGAHIGYFTTLACARAGDSGCVDAYEPHPRSYELLCANLRLNHFAHVARTFRQAVAATPGPVRLSAFEVNAASSTLSTLPDRVLEEFGEHPREIESEAVTLDEQYRGVRQRFDFVKIDAEGSEALIFDGAREFLATALKPDCVIVFEYNPPAAQGLGLQPAAALDHLAQLGFTLLELKPDGSQLPGPVLCGVVNATILARRAG